ncbi:MAG: substrate-binding domain-containing protein, partial [Oscillospiraceae bacterium]|nr:substrate-binding domain-containing protein [Oscillospiraceae bacterium]
MRKHVSMILTLVLALTFVMGGVAQAATYRVAYIAREQADAFAAWLANSVIAEAAKYPNIELSVFNGESNDERQNGMIENAITNRFDVIIVQPNNGEAQRPYVEQVVEAGIFA